MEPKNNKKLNTKNIEKIIIDTFKSVLKMSSNELNKSRLPGKPSSFEDPSLSCKEGPVLIYPNYRNEESAESPASRMSEQELKQKFIETLLTSEINCFYSVETPSEISYNFKDENPKEDSNGQSALFDLSLYDETRKIFSHLEFKHGNVKRFCIAKDLYKLSREAGTSEDSDRKNYFIHIIDGFDSRTKDSLTTKYIGKPSAEEELYKIIQKGLGERVVIYLLVVRNQMKQFGGNQKDPVQGYFKLHYENNSLNWDESWHSYDK